MIPDSLSLWKSARLEVRIAVCRAQALFGGGVGVTGGVRHAFARILVAIGGSVAGVVVVVVVVVVVGVGWWWWGG